VAYKLNYWLPNYFIEPKVGFNRKSSKYCKRTEAYKSNFCNMKKIALSMWFAASLAVAFAQGITDPRQHKVVMGFIEAFKPLSKEKIAARTLFPLKREYPLPPVLSKTDFIKRFNEVFDEILLSKIAASNPSTDWSAMGEKGYMLGDGEVWLDNEGKLIAVNDQSAAEKQMRDALVEADKKGLHASIRAFLNPVCVLETAKFRVRIDELAEGGYRYASWRISAKTSDKPELVLKNGVFEPDGSGGNHRYVFQSGDYRYVCSIILLGEKDSPQAFLTVYKGEREILSQPAVRLR
jgi:hypothetical protein